MWVAVNVSHFPPAPCTTPSPQCVVRPVLSCSNHVRSTSRNTPLLLMPRLHLWILVNLHQQQQRPCVWPTWCIIMWTTILIPSRTCCARWGITTPHPATQAATAAVPVLQRVPNSPSKYPADPSPLHTIEVTTVIMPPPTTTASLTIICSK